MTSSYSHCFGCGSWVVDHEFMIWVASGCPLWCWVVGGCALWSWIVGYALWSWIIGCAGLQIHDIGCGLRVVMDRWLCSVVVDRWLCWVANSWYGLWWSWIVGCAGLQIRDMGCGLRVSWVAGGCFSIWIKRWRDRDERWETEERESDKILLFFYNTCYSAILCIELHCSSIAKKFAILLFRILQCRWF